MKKKILVVDDDENILEAISLILQMEGYDVVSDSGMETMEKLESEKPDLVLMDVLLGGESGIELCKQIKALPDLKVPVILISAHVDYGKNYQEFKADGFIAKPFELGDFVKTIKSAFN